jgi:hypothetical protein
MKKLSREEMKNVMGGMNLVYQCHLTPSANYASLGCNYDLDPKCSQSLSDCIHTMNGWATGDPCISEGCCDF